MVAEIEILFYIYLYIFIYILITIVRSVFGLKFLYKPERRRGEGNCFPMVKTEKNKVE